MALKYELPVEPNTKPPQGRLVSCFWGGCDRMDCEVVVDSAVRGVVTALLGEMDHLKLFGGEEDLVVIAPVYDILHVLG